MFKPYTKKPVPIEAAELTVENMEEMAKNVGGQAVVGVSNPHMKVVTKSGRHICYPGDMIIRGVEGEVYPCPSLVFAKSYEAVPEKKSYVKKED